MSLKPAIIRDVPADAVSLKRAIGPKLGKLFVASPTVAKYALVLKFPDGVVTGRSLGRAIEKLACPRGFTLIVGTGFTLEARQIVEAEGYDLLSGSEFVWTDATYAERHNQQ
jgi:hypothetical protein